MVAPLFPCLVSFTDRRNNPKKFAVSSLVRTNPSLKYVLFSVEIKIDHMDSSVGMHLSA